jgi:hypothetical protein
VEPEAGLTYTGPERRSEGQRVVINAVKNGAQADVEELLAIVRKVARWLKVVGIVVSLGFIGGVFTAGAWYFKVNDHIERDEVGDTAQDELIHTLSEKQARTLGVLEGMDRRLELLEERNE